MITRIYASSCERDGKNFFDVPKKLQDKVREIIEADGYVINEDGTVVKAEVITQDDTVRDPVHEI